MIAEDQITDKLQKLPPRLQREVLDFIDFLSQRVEEDDDVNWKRFSLAQAMRDLENDGTPEYVESDLKERWQ